LSLLAFVSFSLAVPVFRPRWLIIDWLPIAEFRPWLKKHSHLLNIQQVFNRSSTSLQQSFVAAGPIHV
jgi:hypothetical protein